MILTELFYRLRSKIHYKLSGDVQNLSHCPRCGSLWYAERIPEASRAHFGGKSYFSRLIGIYDSRRDRVTEWECPDCHSTWQRYT